MADLFGESAALLQGANTAASNYQQNQTAQDAERNRLFMGGQTNLTQMMGQVMQDQARLQQQQMQETGATQRQAMAGQTALQREAIQHGGAVAMQAMQEKANMIVVDEKTAKLAAKAYKEPSLESFAGQEMPLNKWSAIQKAAADSLAENTKGEKGEGVQSRFDEAQRRRRENDILAYTERLEKNPQLLALKNQEFGMSQIPNLIDLIKSGNTVASAALGLKMAKGLGEVGVMTEKDVTRYVQSGMLTQAIADKILRLAKGKPTDATLDEMNKIQEYLAVSTKEKMNDIYGKYVNRLSRNYKIDEEEAAFLMDVPYDPVYKNSNSGATGAGDGGQKADPLGIR